MRQFVVCKYAAGGRGYTYHNDGAALAIGDKAVVDGPRGDKLTVTVTKVDVPAPQFQTKPVLEKAPAS